MARPSIQFFHIFCMRFHKKNNFYENAENRMFSPPISSYNMEVVDMTTKEKVQFLVSHGVSLVELAKRAECNSSTLGRWIRNDSELSKRLEKIVEQMVRDYVRELEVIKGKEG